MTLREMWRRWQTRGDPEHMVTKEEAIERVRLYAEANGHQFHEPSVVRIEHRQLDPKNRKAGFRIVYLITLGLFFHGPVVEVDASDGEVILWRCFLR